MRCLLPLRLRSKKQREAKSKGKSKAKGSQKQREVLLPLRCLLPLRLRSKKQREVKSKGKAKVEFGHFCLCLLPLLALLPLRCIAKSKGSQKQRLRSQKQRCKEKVRPFCPCALGALFLCLQSKSRPTQARVPCVMRWATFAFAFCLLLCLIHWLQPKAKVAKKKCAPFAFASFAFALPFAFCC